MPTVPHNCPNPAQIAAEECAMRDQAIKRPQITNVHVDNVNYDATHAAAGFSFGEYRYHIWFNPKTMKTDRVLHKNPIKESEYRRRSEHRACDPEAKANKPMVEEMWRQIKEGNMIAEAIRIESYEPVRHEAETENARFDLRIKFRPVAAACLPGGALPNEAESEATISKIVAAMEWAQTQ